MNTKAFGFLLLFISELAFSHGLLNRSNCHEKVLTVIEGLFEPHREKLTQCKEASDCVYMPGGKGFHVNREQYFEMAECLSYAQWAGSNFCDCGKREQCTGGFGIGWSPGKIPNEYKCFENRCVAVFYDNLSLERKWKPIEKRKTLPKDVLEACKKTANESLSKVGL